MSACKADIICIAQITLKEIYNVLLVDNWRFKLLSFELIFDLAACKDRMYFGIYLHVGEHGIEPCEVAGDLGVLRGCSGRFDCLIFEMFFVRDLTPGLNGQSDSIRAGLFA